MTPRTRAAALILAALTAAATGCSSSGTTPKPAGHSTPATANTSDTLTAVANWYNQGGQARITAISNDASHTPGANAATLRGICVNLLSDAASAQSYAPIPDPQMQTAWANALAQYVEGSKDCITGIDTDDADQIRLATSELAAARGFMDQATARAAQLLPG